jgi:hypothetical protein
MAATTHHGFPVPDPTDEVSKVRIHITDLAEDIDAKVKKITYGVAGDALPAAPREGDIHLTYLPSAVVPPPPPAPEPAAVATPKRSRKATG